MWTGAQLGQYENRIRRKSNADKMSQKKAIYLAYDDNQVYNTVYRSSRLLSRIRGFAIVIALQHLALIFSGSCVNVLDELGEHTMVRKARYPQLRLRLDLLEKQKSISILSSCYTIAQTPCARKT